MEASPRLERERLLAEQKQSGQSIAEFCRARGIDPQLLYEYRKRQASKQQVGGSFARVQTGTAVTLELPGSGIRISTALESLRAVLRELESK